MRRSRFTEEQIVAALKEHAAGAGTKDLCRRLGIAVETLYFVSYDQQYDWWAHTSDDGLHSSWGCFDRSSPC